MAKKRARKKFSKNHKRDHLFVITTYSCCQQQTIHKVIKPQLLADATCFILLTIIDNMAVVIVDTYSWR